MPVAQGTYMTSDDLKKTAKDIGDSVGDVAEHAGDKASETGSVAASRVKGAAQQGASYAQDAFGRAKDGVAGLGDQLPDSASDALDASRKAYSRGSDQFARQVAKQPIEALLLAGAIGYLVGWAANRS